VQAVITDKKVFEGKLIKSKFGLDIISDIQDLFEPHPNGDANGASISLLKFFKQMIKSEQLNITEVSKILSYMKSENGSNIVYDPKLKNFFEKRNDDGIDEHQDNLQKKRANEKQDDDRDTKKSKNNQGTPEKQTQNKNDAVAISGIDPQGSPLKNMMKIKNVNVLSPQEAPDLSSIEEDEEEPEEKSNDSNATPEAVKEKISQKIQDKVKILDVVSISSIGNHIRNYCFRRAKFVNNPIIESDFMQDVKKKFYKGKDREDEYAENMQDIRVLIKTNITSKRQYVNKQIAIALHGKFIHHVKSLFQTLVTDNSLFCYLFLKRFVWTQ
jgi:hypothetical protein